MKREVVHVQRLDKETVLKALKYCAEGICNRHCPLYKSGLACKNITPLLESCFVIISGEDKRREEALKQFAGQLKGQFSEDPSVVEMIDKELSDVLGGVV